MQKFIDINKIRNEEKIKRENYLKINNGLKNLEDFYKEDKTTTIVIKDSINKDKIKLMPNYNDNDNSIINKNNLKDNNDYNHINDSSKIIQKTNKQLDYNIDITAINEFEERRINELIFKIKDPNLNFYQKRNIIKLIEKTLTEDLRMAKKLTLDIEKKRKEYYDMLNNKKIENKNIDSMNTYEKNEQILKSMNTETTEIENIINKIDEALLVNTMNSNICNSISDQSKIRSRVNDECQNEISSICEQSTKDSSQIKMSQNRVNSNEISSICEQSTKDSFQIDQSIVNNSKTLKKDNSQSNEKKFNNMRAKYYINQNIFDIQYCDEIQVNNIITSPKYKIDEEHYGIVYNNDLKTNYMTKSTYLSGKSVINELPEEETQGEIFNQSVGLYFCGEEINLENEGKAETKKCEANNFICKKCMETNKKLYNIKSKYLINIKGRVAKINKGGYHCFGHFLCDSQIEDCITSFSCMACNLLNKYSYYYK